MNSTPSPNVLVCVTDQLSCERLIRAGAVIAKKQDLPVSVVSVLPEGFVSEKTASVLQGLYDTALALGADMTFYFNNDPALTAAVHAKTTGAMHIVSGAPGIDSSLFIETVKNLLPEIPMSIVDAGDRMYTFPAINAVIQPTIYQR